MSKKQLPLLAVEYFDLDGRGKIENLDPDEDENESPVAAWADADFVICQKCESDNINFNGQARAKYMPRLQHYTCKDCGHRFDEGDWLKEL